MPMIRFTMLLLIASSVLLAAGSPELLIAIRNGDYTQVQKLLRVGADVDMADGDGTTALMHAVIESDVKMMKLLIGSGANINAGNALDSTALMYACSRRLLSGE
jgi:ankyrin repeat protein